MNPEPAPGTGPVPDEALLASDEPRIARLQASIDARRRRGAPVGRDEERLAALVAASRAAVSARRASAPVPSFPADLPVVRERAAIEAAIRGHQVVIVCGETGSGKTTQLPKLLLGLGRGTRGLIGHTQPRRIAARSVAARIAEELGSTVGHLVGYQVRFTDRSAPDTLVKLMTDGILLAEIRNDPELRRYDTLIVDEAHERSLNIDFLLGYLRGLLPRRPDLKLVITSATIEPARFAAYFGGAPVVMVEGRGYPIETRYRPPEADGDDAFDPGLSAAIIAAVREILAEPGEIGRGDVLVFLPGEREIREAADALEQALGRRLDVLPLFSRLSWAEQQKIFERHGRQRVVLSTNVAETSLTVPGIRSVVDSGLARLSRYSPRAKIQRLPVEPVSQASANQRRGRCGRVGDGLCVRLYAEDEFALRAEQTPPEVLRTNLASVILQMSVLGLGQCADFPFLDPPDTRLINDGYRLLQELEAVDGEREVTPIGRQMARLPVDPRIARMLVAAARGGALAEMLPLAAVLSLADPRERPADAQQAADDRHAAWADERSDFVGLLNLWRAYQAERATLSRSALRRWCQGQFLSAQRMREWEDLYAQLVDVAAGLDWRLNDKPADYEALHRAILAGLLGQVGMKDEAGGSRPEYRGPRGLRFSLAPGSRARNRAPRYVVCGQITETTRVYARQVARVEPDWIEAVGAHLVKREYTEPAWDAHRGIVTALETVTLFGLVLIGGRRVNYGRVAPAEARAIFVREALVHGQCRIVASFRSHNAGLRARLVAEEAALRRHAVLVDETVEAEFYLRLLPPDVHSVATFETWRRRAEHDRPGLLCMTEADLRRPDAAPLDRAAYPVTFVVGANELPLSYVFDPQAVDDGAILTVPVPLVAKLEAGTLDWGVPGWRREKVTELIRGLPKALRRHLVPAPDVAERAIAEFGGLAGLTFAAAVSEALRRVAGVEVDSAMLAAVELPAHLRLFIRAVDAEGRAVAAGRDLSELKRALRHVDGRLPPATDGGERDGVRDWDFGMLEESVQVVRQGVRLELHPALVDRGETVSIVLVADATDAARQSRAGIVRLACLALGTYLRSVTRDVAADRDLMLLHQPLGPAAGLPKAIVERAVRRVGLPEGSPLPRSRAEFEALVERCRTGVAGEAQRLAALARETLKLRAEAARGHAGLSAAFDRELVEDLSSALARLVRPGFVTDTPEPWLAHLPRYLRALSRRIAKLAGASGAVLAAQYDLRDRWRRYAALERHARQDHPHGTPALTDLRWWLEEYAVSLFAQDLKTAVPVSAKRLAEAEVAARRSLDLPA
jgi:ATP-dependent helicase HrpA